MKKVRCITVLLICLGLSNPFEGVTQVITVPNNGGGNPFYLWAGGNTVATSHMRIGTDYSHQGDAAIEIFQHYPLPTPPDPGRVIINGNLGVGTLYPSERLSVNGKIKAQEVNVTTSGWPDYVFDPAYKLLPLSEVRRFYETNRHLPDIPNEKEVQENGVNLSDMTARLLEKVEELTIYLVQQQDKIGELEKEIRKLKGED